MCSILKLIELKCPFWACSHVCNVLLWNVKAGRITSNCINQNRNRKARGLVKLSKGRKDEKTKGPSWSVIIWKLQVFFVFACEPLIMQLFHFNCRYIVFAFHSAKEKRWKENMKQISLRYAFNQISDKPLTRPLPNLNRYLDINGCLICVSVDFKDWAKPTKYQNNGSVNCWLRF